MNRIAPVLFLAMVANLGCSKRNEPSGLADWPAVMRVTEGMLNRGETARFLEKRKLLRMSQVFQSRFDFRLMIVDFGFLN